jgi:hypothetical protein
MFPKMKRWQRFIINGEEEYVGLNSSRGDLQKRLGRCAFVSLKGMGYLKNRNPGCVSALVRKLAMEIKV